MHRVSPPDSSPIGGLDAVERNGLTGAGNGSTDVKESGDAARCAVQPIVDPIVFKHQPKFENTKYSIKFIDR